MKQALALIFLSCVLCAQDKPAAEAPKPAAAAPELDFSKVVAEVDAREKAKLELLQAPINIKDELIEEINALKEQITKCRQSLANNETALGTFARSPSSDNNHFASARVRHESNISLLIESQRALVLALVELAKETDKKEPTKAYHGRWNPPPGSGMSR